jgi:hypothetical protein
MQELLKLACFLSMMSISMNTQETVKVLNKSTNIEFVGHILFVVDICVTLLFTLEAVAKMWHKGLLAVRHTSILIPHTCQFTVGPIVSARSMVHLRLFHARVSLVVGD